MVPATFVDSVNKKSCVFDYGSSGDSASSFDVVGIGLVEHRFCCYFLRRTFRVEREIEVVVWR